MKKNKPFSNLDNIELSTSFRNFLRWQKEKRRPFAYTQIKMAAQEGCHLCYLIKGLCFRS